MKLPEPNRERWQPLRIGLDDIFYYDHQEFAFRDGRLLLRGNNGTGKSKVLALTLPFLLDGELSPHRVEPDADSNKRMEWNLLLGGEHPNTDRLGYTWLEFGRIGDHGSEFCAIGCGMKASAGRGITSHWFFITDLRVGEELSLVDHTGVALSADRLAEELGARGTVHRRKRDYRRAIDERLFGLGEQRYGALIDLLVKVRQPQLSKRPDERSLSTALTDALPPLDQALVHNVAEAFRALEDDAAELQAMIETREASERYLATYRASARMATRRRAAPLRRTQTVVDRLGREVTAAEQQHRDAVTELVAAREHLATLRTEQARLNSRHGALRADPLTRSAQELHRAGEDAETAERQLQEAQTALQNLTDRIAMTQGRLTEAD
ncbi:MAG: TIGR02680 family protein, partial [Solirubrobacteraceae bacterium]